VEILKLEIDKDI